MSYLRTKLPESLPVETVREPWRQVLLDAAEYIRVHGHCKGKFDLVSGEACAWGAIMKVTPERNWLMSVRALECRVGPIPSWNDQPETTPEHVIEVMPPAARSALREGEK